jgi:hypothetical protein
MKRCFSLPRLAPLALSALLLCGCANQSLIKAGIPALTVNLSALDTCKAALADVALPPVTAATDARAAFVADDAKLIEARGEIAIGRTCITDVQQSYAQAH